MLFQQVIKVEDLAEFKSKAIKWASSQVHFCYLNGNNISYPYDSFPEIIAVADATKGFELTDFNDFKTSINKNWIFGYFGYEFHKRADALKNKLDFHNSYFFSAQTIITFLSLDEIKIESIYDIGDVINQIQTHSNTIFKSTFTGQVSPLTLKNEYLDKIQKLKDHLNRGDIYQINYCIQFDLENIKIDVLDFYQRLNSASPTPFSGILKIEDKIIFSASPERYLKRMGDVLLSQPMKGTAARNSDPLIDQENKQHLKESVKERAENIMIVDLVRNDFSRVCKEGTVDVENLCQILSFTQVHQMISTVKGEIANDSTIADVFHHTFPMGSMTGAPKIRAMELIEKFEETNRGPFSGAMGYVTPDGDFDFNVLIRSVFYDHKSAKGFFCVGSGITALSNPEEEYEECMLKASNLNNIFISLV